MNFTEIHAALIDGDTGPYDQWKAEQDEPREGLPIEAEFVANGLVRGSGDWRQFRLGKIIISRMDIDYQDAERKLIDYLGV
ncbi:MAG: hypothetical protein WC551_10715 [Patescibacteria group bacterium]